MDLEFNKTIAATKYKVTVTAPYDKKFKTIERFVEADKLMAAGADKVKASVTGLPTGKFLAFKLEALEADNCISRRTGRGRSRAIVQKQSPCGRRPGRCSGRSWPLRLAGCPIRTWDRRNATRPSLDRKNVV